MRLLSVPELLGVWERSLGERSFERALELLAAAAPELPRSTLARFSIGRRDVLLFHLRRWAFGSELAVLVSCPQCRQTLETTLPMQQLQAPLDKSDRACGQEIQIVLGEYHVRCRPLNSEDLNACAGSEMEQVRAELFARCVAQARYQGQSVSPDELPPHVCQAVVDRIAEVDPQADIRLDFSCPDCQHCWSETFDIVSFFWTEIDAWARRTLREVHVLAGAYGWPEREILALSPSRRQIYLAMAEA